MLFLHTHPADSDGQRSVSCGLMNTFRLFPSSLDTQILLGLTFVLSLLYHTHLDITKGNPHRTVPIPIVFPSKQQYGGTEAGGAGTGLLRYCPYVISRGSGG